MERNVKVSAAPRILFYTDMEAATAHCVAAAEILRAELGAHIIMTVPNRGSHFHEAFLNYELYDHQSVFQRSGRLVAIKTVPDSNVKLRVTHIEKYNDRSNESAGCSEGGPILGACDPSAPLSGKIILNEPKAPQVIQLFGLRKFLARSRTLKAIYWAVFSYENMRIPRLVWEILQLRRRALYVKLFLRSVRPDIIILAEDNVETLSTTIVNEGRRQGIPAVIVPFTIPNPLEPAKAYRNRRSNQVRNPIDRLVSSLYPKWCFRLDGQPLLRMPAALALALEALGQSSPAPWILNRGNASRIALDSEAQREFYLKRGFPAGQLSVIGDINSKVLNRAQVSRIRLLSDILARHNFPSGRPLLLCGFPPNQYGSKADHFEFQSYDDLVEAWIESFAALGERANVLVRPHPRVSLDRFERYNVPNVRFTMQPTAELIPLCDLYVASISATIRWAIACGVPVINYDTYRYRYGDYDTVGGVISTESLTDFRDQLTRFVNDPSFAASLVERQRGEMARWGMVDEELPNRFSALVVEVIHANARERSLS